MHALTTSATAAANASATTAGALANSRRSARVAASKRVVGATAGRVPVADRRAVVASVATRSEIVAPTVDAPPAKTVYDAVLYSFADDGSATILTRADLDAVNAAMHVNVVAMSAEKGTEQVADTAKVTDTDSIADTDAAEDGECEEACPLVFGEPEPNPDNANVDAKKSDKTAPDASLAHSASMSQAEVTRSLGDAAGLGASAYSSDDVLCMMYGVDVDKEDAEHKVAFFCVDGAVAGCDSIASAAAAAADLAAGRVPAPPRTTSNVGGESNAGRSSGVADLFRNIWSRLGGLGAVFGGVLDKDPERSGKKTGAVGAAAFAGVSTSEAASIADRINSEHVEKAVYPEAARYAKQLRYDGYKIVLVTSQPDWLVAPLARSMGASRVIGSRLEVDESAGTFTGGSLADADDDGQGAIPGVGDALVRRVRAFAADAGVDLAKSIAYGAGERDLPLMRICGKAYAVSPDAAVAAAASENGWQTLGWAEDAERKALKAGEFAAMDAAMEEARAAGTLQPAYATVTVNGGAVSAKSRAWTVMDPDQYDPENDRRRG